jgi:hypothetical protein
MKWGMGSLVAAAVAGSLAGCSDGPSSPAVPDAVLQGLVQRVVALKESVAATGRITADQRLELAVLQQDVNRWHAETGRSDIAVSTSRHTRPAINAAASGGGGASSCDPCPVIKTMGSKVCFLIEDGDCTPDDIVAKVCAYICFDVPPSTPIKVTPKVPTGPLTRS